MKRISTPEALAALSVILLASATIAVIFHSLLTRASAMVIVSLVFLLAGVIMSCMYLAHRISRRLATGAAHDKVDRRRAIGLYGLTLCAILAFVTLPPSGSFSLLDYGSLCTFAPFATALTFLVGILLYCYGERRTKALYATTITLLIGFSGASYWICNVTIPFSQIQGSIVIDDVYAVNNSADITFNVSFTNPTDLDLPSLIVYYLDLYINGSKLQHGTYYVPCCYSTRGASLRDHQNWTQNGEIVVYLGNGSSEQQTKLDGANIADLWKSISSGTFTLRLVARLVGYLYMRDITSWYYSQLIFAGAKVVDLLCGPP